MLFENNFEDGKDISGFEFLKNSIFVAEIELYKKIREIGGCQINCKQIQFSITN